MRQFIALVDTINKEVCLNISRLDRADEKLEKVLESTKYIADNLIALGSDSHVEYLGKVIDSVQKAEDATDRAKALMSELLTLISDNTPQTLQIVTEEDTDLDFDGDIDVSE